jgi:glycerate kinase
LKVLAAFDSFKGTMSAQAIGHKLALALSPHEVIECPLSDGGEGFLEVVADYSVQVPTVDALGRACDGRLGFRKLGVSGSEVILETAQAIGLTQVGGAAGNDPIRADSIGVALLLEEALKRRPTAILVGCGGSAVTDGGLGFIRRMRQRNLIPCGVPMRVALDVRTRFTQAGIIFAPQKGATPKEVEILTARLVALHAWYRRWYGIDLDQHVGTGAAGGLGGALMAVGAVLSSGFDEVASRVQLSRHISKADLVLTGEGRLDETSFDGKVVGEVLRLAESQGKQVVVMVGSANSRIVDRVHQRGHRVYVLSELFGNKRSFANPLQLLVELARSVVA